MRGLLRDDERRAPADEERVCDASVRQVRQDGVAYDFEENVIGGVCLGTVVRNHTGRAVAALSISGPTHRLTSERIEQLVPVLLEQCAALSARLGHTDVERGAA